MNFSGKSFAFSKNDNIPDTVNMKPSYSPNGANSSSAFQHMKNTLNSNQMTDRKYYDNNDDYQHSPINKDSMGYDDDDEENREENNLSFEQLKNELIIHKRKKKDNNKKVKINEITDKSLKPTEAECTIRFVGEETPEDTDDYWRMISLLEPFKQKAKTVVELFLPSIHTLRKFLRVRT